MEQTRISILHNAGFFSCCTIRLIEIMKYFNQHKRLPDIVDSSAQFAFFKKKLTDDIVEEFFESKSGSIEHYADMLVSNEVGEVSFSDYSKLRFDDLKPFIDLYFAPSKKVRCMVSDYIENYKIDFENTCAVFYRGNDKQKECVVTPYADFIIKANEILQTNPDIRFLVQPDETEFLDAFRTAFPDRCFHFKETPHMRKKNSSIFFELPLDKKTEHGCYFLAAVITMAKCKHVITHSGNGSLFLALYRGNTDNLHQFMNKHIY